MKPFTKAITLLLLLGIVVQSCSRKTNNFVNRTWHSVGTEYNVLYNGELALDQGLIAVNDVVIENFWELLPIEPMEIRDELRLDNKAENSNFERAEEKAVKAIQKHSMTIEGKEKNPQIDESYLLLGKARYYDQRFVPALAAFNTILNRYPTSDKINQVKVWREKANLRLGNPELTIKNLIRHLKQEEVEGQDLADIAAVLAAAYIDMGQKELALKYLDTAAVATRIINQKARYNFIRGQLYDAFEKKDSANTAYDAVMELHRKIPRAFYINAHLAKSNNFDSESGDKRLFLEYLTELEENRENRPFLDKIYHRIALFHQTELKDSISELYYNRSLGATKALKKDEVLNAKNYLTLGDMYFDKTKYSRAGAYYDSTLTNMVEKTKPYRVVKKKRENLDDVIYYEGIAKANDSILTMVNLPKEKQIAAYNVFIQQLKAKDSLSVKITKNKTIKQASSRTGIQGNLPGRAITSRFKGLGGNDNSDFYFYSQTTVAYGKNEFLRLWGQRQLQDNWRLSNSRVQSDSVTQADDNTKVNVTQLERYDPDFYIKTLPTDQTVLDSIAKERNFAYYRLGLIYKENFKEYTLAKNKLETLLTNAPEERLVLPSKYNLFKIYELLGANDKAEITKNRIISEHPKSRYAEILKNPESKLAKDANSPETIYEGLYKKFENQDYAEVISLADMNIKTFEGEDFAPKFEILKASALGRLKGFEAYKDAVNYVALTYPNAEEGKKAQEILANAIPALQNSDFQPQEDGEFFNVIYQFETKNTDEIDDFTKALNKEIAKVTYYKWSLSKDVYDENTTFVVVHGLRSFSLASAFGQTLQDYKEKKTRGITKIYIPISSYNYTIVQRHKNLGIYITSN